MRTIIRIIPSALEKYFWNLVRIRNAFLLCAHLFDRSQELPFRRRTAEVLRLTKHSFSPESASHRTMINATLMRPVKQPECLIDRFILLHAATCRYLIHENVCQVGTK